MAYDPFYSMNPSDSGLLDGIESPFGTPGGQAGPSPAGSPVRRSDADRASGNVPHRDEYEAPEPGAIDAEAPEDSLRDVPLPEGYAARLRGFIGDL